MTTTTKGVSAPATEGIARDSSAIIEQLEKMRGVVGTDNAPADFITLIKIGLRPNAIVTPKSYLEIARTSAAAVVKERGLERHLAGILVDKAVAFIGEMGGFSDAVHNLYKRDLENYHPVPGIKYQ